MIIKILAISLAGGFAVPVKGVRVRDFGFDTRVSGAKDFSDPWRDFGSRFLQTPDELSGRDDGIAGR